MFYVIKKAKTFRNEAGEFGSFKDAERFRKPDPYVVLEQHEQWVGPCEEDEEP